MGHLISNKTQMVFLFENSTKGSEDMERDVYKDLPPLLSRKEVQDVLKIGKNGLLNLIKEGQLPTVMVNKRKKIRKEDLIAFIEEHVENKNRV